ncbi:chromate efflux transporter [Haloechinothrix sp. LS1_15]|uniref:chromate efflux transporter n=1 Tax=Haloechinothrix sp. LS1_15 TaxID=2652248 RepID=UPI002947AE58|nr:chromate efflux transporter [Haloechinothrix sp. LS1_15]MDV6012506.1 chromate efflux transporter [Haloechinothrix sp. LS1_15]
MSDATGISPQQRGGTVGEVFAVFLGLGLTSFGGPVAHLGYFRDTFVRRRQWLGERAYADLVALCQFLPGPASSQVGMAIGLHRAGIGGLLAAWTAFTLPSAIALVAFAYGATAVGMDGEAGWIDGLKASAVAVVAHAVAGMARNLTPDKERATIAVAGMIGAMLAPTAIGQVLVIAAAAVAGLIWLRPPERQHDGQEGLHVRVGRKTAAGCLVAFGTLLAALPVLAATTGDGIVRLIDGFYRAGSLVFGGGHVVLPLLQAETVRTGLVDTETFLAGYGAAQAVPGPLFTFAAYLGTFAAAPPTGVAGAAIALLAIFLPSALLVLGVLPFWERLRGSPLAQRALMGVNAGVVGLLAAALYTPVFTSGVTSTATMAIAAASFVALATWRVPAWAVVITAGAAGALVL